MKFFTVIYFIFVVHSIDDCHPLSVRRYAPSIKRLKRTPVAESKLLAPSAAYPQPRWAYNSFEKGNAMNKSYSFVIGRAAALAIAIETIVFAISLVWEMISPTELPKILGYIASLLIAVSVVIMIACFYDGTRQQLKIFGLLAFAASIIYATFCISTYFLQLSNVSFNPLNLSDEVMKAIAFKPGSPTFAIDQLGYGFLCLSTLAAGFALVEAKDKVLRVLCFFHGAIAVPTFAGPIISGIFLSPSGQTDYTGYFVLLFWSAVFVPIALLFMRYFKEGQNL
jgi:hypothetical protein